MYLIIGATGYLGSYLITNVLSNTKANIIATYNSNFPNKTDDRIKWEKLNLEDFNSIDIFFNNIKGHSNLKVIFLSSYHHPDKVEENPKLAWHVNVGALDYFLNKSKNLISTLFYASSDSVYGESINNYVFNEKDLCSPLNTYGRTKFIAEQVVLLYNFNVIRYSFLIGPSIIKKEHFYDYILKTLKNNANIHMFSDSYRNPIDFNSAAYYTVNLCERYPNIKKEIINIAGDKSLSKYDVAMLIAKNNQLRTKNIKKISITDKENIKFFQTKRAQSTLISNKKLKKLLNINTIELKGM